MSNHEHPRLIMPKRHFDSRGWFSETYYENRVRKAGFAAPFVQDSQSFSLYRGTIHGLHFQRPPAAQVKLISVLHGRILDVAVDIRRGSPTFGKYFMEEISAICGQQFYIPTGFAHGFITLDDDVLVFYKVSQYHTPECAGGIHGLDPELAIPWPMDEHECILSDKDKCLPLFKELDTPFDY